MNEYKTTLNQRLAQKRYREHHLREQREATHKWKREHPQLVKQLNLKWNKINNPLLNPQRIKFKTKRVFLGFNPRKGICSRCDRSVAKGEIKQTHIHHLQYDESNPLAHTIELCASCHAKHHINGVQK